MNKTVTLVENPQGFIVNQECQKAAYNNGFRRKLDEKDGWAAYASTTAQGTLYLAAAGAQGPWYLALDHAGVIAELDLSQASMPGPGCTRYIFEKLEDLYFTLPRVYELGVSLPDAPIKEFEAKIKNLPKTTEAERLVLQRIGQNIFRKSLMEHFKASCPLTGITNPELLRASHIIPWKECKSNAKRLDLHNGILLSALWDAAFDRGLVTFDDHGKPEFSPSLSNAALKSLIWDKPIELTNLHRERLAWHRKHIFKNT